MVSVSAGSNPHLAAELPQFLADVRIDYGEVPTFLPDAVVRGVLYEASRTEALLEVPDIARLHIRRDAITVVPLGHDVAAALGPYLRRTPLMVLMLLRGGFGANGAALAGPDGAVVVIGRTVSGKSTLAAALMQRGLRLLADDAAPILLGADGRVWVYPVWPEMILWPEAVEALFCSAPLWLNQVESEIPRCRVAAERWCDHPMPLKRLYRLHPDRLEDGPGENALEGFAKITHGTFIPYQPELAAALFDPAALLHLYGAIGSGRTKTLVFPQSAIAEMDKLADDIIEDCGWSSLT